LQLANKEDVIYC